MKGEHSENKNRRLLLSLGNMRRMIAPLLVLTLIAVAIYSAPAMAETRYWIGEDTNLSIDQDNTLFIDVSNNRVGIGTTSPGEKLTISGASAGLRFDGGNNRIYFNGYRALEGATDGSNLQIGENYALSTIYGSTAIALRTGGAEKVRIDNTGNVGIGTTSPQSKLQVNGNILITEQGFIGTRNTANTDYAYTFQMPYGSGQDLLINPQLHYRNTIVSYGNVGIGISPTQKLHVAGNALFDYPLLGGTSAMRAFTNLVSYTSETGGETGAFVIQTNIPQDDHTMIKVNVDVYGSYGDPNKNTCEISISGYWSSEANGGFQGLGYTGLCPTKPLVRLGRNTATGKSVIIIGDTGDSWSYPKVYVSKAILGYGISDSYADGWTITRTTDISGYSNLDTVPDKTTITNADTVDSKHIGTINQNYVVKMGGSSTLGQSVIYDDGSYVGIGTTGPALRLDISGTLSYPATSGTTQTGVFRIGNSGNNAVLDFGQGPGSPWPSWIQSTDKTNLAATYPLVLNPNGGNVGIGTTGPGAKLDVAYPSGVGTNTGVRFTYNADTNYRLDINQIVSSGLVKHSFDVTNAGTAYAGNLVLDRGNVGIGTTGPGALLNVYRNDAAVTQQVLIEQDGSGDASIGFRETGGQDWSIGFDNTDNSFRIKPSTDLASGNGLIITTGGDATFGAVLTVTQDLTVNGGDITLVDGGTIGIGGAKWTFDDTNDDISTAGNVGIGTTTPDSNARLHLYGQPYLHIQNTGGEATIKLTAGSTTTYIGNGGWGITQGKIGIGDGSAPTMTVDTGADYVGIGTTSPGYLLHVAGDTYVEGNLFVLKNITNVNANTINVNGTFLPALTSAFDIGSSAKQWRAMYASTNISAPIYYDSDNGAYYANPAGTSVFNALTVGGNAVLTQGSGYIGGSGSSGYVPKFNGTNSITNSAIYDNGGNVGIGTTGPGAKLQIGASAGLNSGTILAVGGTQQYGILADVNNNETGKGLTIGYSSTGGMIGARGGTQDLFFAGGDSSGYGDKGVLIDRYGNVGIGTTSPSTKLHVKSPDVPMVVQTDGTGSNRALVGFANSAGTLKGSVGLIGADNSIRIGDENDYRITVLQGGNVGIGTTSPGYKLEVGGTLSVNGDNAISGAGLTLGSYTSGSYKWIQSFSSQPLYINPLGNNVILNRDGGNVGVGTTGPDRKLHVYTETAAYTPTLKIHNNNAALAGYGTGIEFQLSSDYTDYKKAEIRAVAEADYANDIGLAFWSGGSTSGDHAERMRINYNGNVGIGTTGPGANLEVKGTAEGGGVSNIKINTDSAYGGVSFWEGGTLRGMIGLGDTGHFFTGASTNSISLRSEADLHLGGTGNNLAMTIKSGNVGIGTTSPGAKAHIYTNTNGDGLRIESDSAGVERAPALQLWPKSASANERNWAISAYKDTAQGLSISSSDAKGGDPYSAGTTRFYIDGTNGNVGIGTTAPDQRLTVLTPSGTDKYAVSVMRQAGSVAALYFGANSDNTAIIASNNADLRLGRDLSGTFSEYVRILNSNGNVGIGTTNPWAPLVFGQASPEIALNSDSGNRFGFQQISATLRIFAGNEGTTYSTQIGSYNGTTFTPKVYIGTGGTYNGNVGIGTTSPGEKLTISGASAGLRFDGGNNRIYFNGYRALEGATDGSNLQIGENYALSTIYGSTAIALRTGGAEKVRIDNTGNVGIGTVSPDTKLFVQTDPASTNSILDVATLARTTTGTAASGLGSRLRFVLEDAGANLIDAGGISSYWVDPAIGVRSANTQITSSLGNSAVIVATFTSTGNVGIGTTGPGALLEISKNGAPTFRITNTAYANKFYDFNIIDSGGLYLKDGNGDRNVLFGDDGSIAVGSSYAVGYNGPDNGMIIEGNVGIGTTAPGALLHVMGSSDVGLNIETTATSNTGAWTLYKRAQTGATATWRIGTGVNTGSNALDFQEDAPSAGTRMTILSGGNVGIGTTGPNVKLEVAGLGRFTGTNAFSVGADAGQNRIDTGGPSLGQVFRFLASSNGYTGINADRAAFGSYAGTDAGTSGYIITSGNVGIGTATPGAKLDVNGHIAISDGNSLYYAGSSNTNQYLTHRVANNDVIFSIDSGDFYYGDIANSAHAWYTGNSERMRITSGGNVGIGTTTPQNKLDVAGNVNMTGDVIVGGNDVKDSTNSNRISFSSGSVIITLG